MKKLLWLLATVVLSLFIIASFSLMGCKEELAEEEATEGEPVKEEAEEVAPEEEEAEEATPVKEVSLVVRTGPEADGLRITAEEYTKKTGVNVEIVEIGREGYLTAVMTQLLGGTTDYDVVWFLSTSIAEMAEAGVLEPLDDYISNPDITDPEEYDSEDLLATYGYKGKTYGLPQTISTNYLYYRSDLIPDPPETWDEYFEVSKEFTKSINPDSPTTYGTTFDCLPGEELPKCFYSVLWTFKGDIIDEDGNVLINNSGSLAAAEWYVKFIEAGILPEDVLTYGYTEVFEALQTGEVAMAGPMWDAAMGGILVGDSPYKNDIKVTMIPGVEQADGSMYRVPFQHSWCFVLNKNSENLEEGWKFLNYATGKEGGKITAIECGSSPARVSLLTDPELLESFPHYELHAESLAIAKSEPAVTFYEAMHDAMNTALTKIITGELEPKEALDSAASEIKELQGK
jgi:multiple sugar transport system substrate-binding protein